MVTTYIKMKRQSELEAFKLGLKMGQRGHTFVDEGFVGNKYAICLQMKETEEDRLLEFDGIDVRPKGDEWWEGQKMLHSTVTVGKTVDPIIGKKTTVQPGESYRVGDRVQFKIHGTHSPRIGTIKSVWKVHGEFNFDLITGEGASYIVEGIDILGLAPNPRVKDGKEADAPDYERYLP